MAKLMNEVTVTVKSGDTEATYTAPQASMSGGAWGKDKKILSIQMFGYEQAELNTKLKEPADPVQAEQTAHEKLVANHAKVILDVLKAAETTRLNIALQRERYEAEFAERERADRVSLTFAIHNAIQAGLDIEDVSANMRDDYAGYVSDMVIKIYEDTDLDTLVNVS